MNVDTQTFQAITEQLDTLQRRMDALDEGLCRTFEAAGVAPAEPLARGRKPVHRARPRHLRRIK